MEKKKFEVRLVPAKNGKIEKQIYIGGEFLDWSVDMSSLLEAKKMGPQFFAAVQKDIEKHFLESVSEFVGRRITKEDLKKAIETGVI